MLSLKIQSLYYQYNDRVVFFYKDYEFLEGITIISAPSGAGKSTLFLLFIREIEIYSGTILLNDYDIKLFCKEKYIYENFSIVFQSGVISYYFTLEKYIQLLLITRKNNKDLVNFYLDLLEIRHLLNENIMFCSGGEKYKIALFLALIKDTSLLLLDEPTSHLDEKNSLIIVNLLKNIKNKIIVIITHDAIFLQNKFKYKYYYL
jgi:iron complex transport system ATP-binding protein